MCGFSPLARPRPLCGRGHPHPRPPHAQNPCGGLRVRGALLRLRGVPDPSRAPGLENEICSIRRGPLSRAAALETTSRNDSRCVLSSRLVISMHTATRALARSPSRPPSNPPNPARAPGQNLPSRTSQSSLPVERPLGPARAISFRIVQAGGFRRRNREGVPRGLVCKLFCSRRSFVLLCALRGEVSHLLRRAPVPRLRREAQEAPHAREAVRRTRRVGTPHGAGNPCALGRPAVCVWGIALLSSLRARSPSLLDDDELNINPPTPCQ